MFESNIRVIDVRPDVFEEYNELVDEAARKRSGLTPAPTRSSETTEAGWSSSPPSAMSNTGPAPRGPGSTTTAPSIRTTSSGRRCASRRDRRPPDAVRWWGDTGRLWTLGLGCEVDPIGQLPGLRGKRGLVVGGGLGIGRATARLLVEQGVRLAIVDSDGDRLKATCDELDAYGICADVLETDRARSAVDEASHQLDGLDILVNVVGRVRRWRTRSLCRDPARRPGDELPAPRRVLLGVRPPGHRGRQSRGDHHGVVPGRRTAVSRPSRVRCSQVGAQWLRGKPIGRSCSPRHPGQHGCPGHSENRPQHPRSRRGPGPPEGDSARPLCRPVRGWHR